MTERNTNALHGLHLRIVGDGIETMYAHLSSTAVLPGETVVAGQSIGLAGNSGASYGAHLHLEMWLNSVRTDPMELLSGLME